MNCVDEIKKLNGSIAMYSDKSAMEASDFEFMEDHLRNLCLWSEKYIDIFVHKEDVEQLKNTAVRLYNCFYSKICPEYTEMTQLAQWNAHTVLIEYLFMLDLVLKAFDEKENKRQNALTEDDLVE